MSIHLNFLDNFLVRYFEAIRTQTSATFKAVNSIEGISAQCNGCLWIPLDAIWTDSSRGIPMINHIWLSEIATSELPGLGDVNLLLWFSYENLLSSNSRKIFKIFKIMPQFLNPLHSFFRSTGSATGSALLSAAIKRLYPPDVIRLIGANLSLVKPLKCSLRIALARFMMFAVWRRTGWWEWEYKKMQNLQVHVRNSPCFVSEFLASSSCGWISRPFRRPTAFRTWRIVRRP